MQAQHQRRSVRDLIESAGLPFSSAMHEPRRSVFLQGDDDDSVMYVESGRVELAAASPSGREAICGLLDAGAFLGEEALAGCSTRPYTATAMTRTEVLCIGKANMVQLLSTHRAFAERFIEHSVNRTARLRADLADQLLYSCEARLARVLLTLADHLERDPLRYALPNVTQDFLARMVGTTRSRVNHFLGKFKTLGFVEERDGVLQINPAMLYAIPGGEGGIPPPDLAGSYEADRYQ